MGAQGTALRSQGHLEQAGRVPGIELQDVTQLQSPTGGLPVGEGKQQHEQTGDIMSTPVQSRGF